MYPSSIKPNRTVFSIVTGLYLIRPNLCEGISLKYLFILISSMNLSNVKTESVIVIQSEKRIVKTLFRSTIDYGWFIHDK